tara:strand:- start:2274 stop:2666 length:393 start_codon:yes stop_codon:yes gene_type:complete
MVVKSRKKFMYWHPIAKGLIEMGLMPNQIRKVLKDIFPKNDITTRKIGAYKRRLADEGIEIVPTNDTISLEAAIIWAKENIDDMDLWIHQLIINGTMADLKCFAFKVDTNESAGPTELEKFEGWMNERIL